MLPSLSLQRHHYRRIGFFAVFVIIFHHRLSVLLTLLYTYAAFTFLPHAVLGDGDGWDLDNLVPPTDAREIVPRIIHQARLGDLEMKEKWVAANASCAKLHPSPEWRFELWDTERANAFVAENYPDLLETYLGYGQGTLAFLLPPTRVVNSFRLAVEIQRSNVIRYLVLYKIGGIYLDLDIKCLKPMDFFLTVDWVSPPGLPVGINNAFMAVAPGHPFLKHTIDNIKRFDLNWVSLYATDM
jgi:mannosyltransferase OCH1-like enzyme